MIRECWHFYPDVDIHLCDLFESGAIHVCPFPNRRVETYLVQSRIYELPDLLRVHRGCVKMDMVSLPETVLEQSDRPDGAFDVYQRVAACDPGTLGLHGFRFIQYLLSVGYLQLVGVDHILTLLLEGYWAVIASCVAPSGHEKDHLAPLDAVFAPLRQMAAVGRTAILTFYAHRYTVCVRHFIIHFVSHKDSDTVKKQTRMVLALDETDGQKALKIVEEVAEYIDAVKINWPLVLSEGPEMITKLSKYTDVICDFKVADIPNTVSLIVSNAVKRGAAAVIVHAFTGDDSLKAAVEAAGNADIYAVTEMSHPGGKMFTAKHAEEMARLGVECGAKGFIAPATRPERIAAIREIIGDRLILSPGVGAQGGSASSAIKAGADYVIVGRAIYKAEDPKAVAKAICDEIRTVL